MLAWLSVKEKERKARKLKKRGRGIYSVANEVKIRRATRRKEGRGNVLIPHTPFKYSNCRLFFVPFLVNTYILLSLIFFTLMNIHILPSHNGQNKI